MSGAQEKQILIIYNGKITMNFKEFLNETPKRMSVDYDEESIYSDYDDHRSETPFTSRTWDKYVIEEYRHPEDRNTSRVFVLDKKLEKIYIQMNVGTENVSGLGKVVRVYHIQKGYERLTTTKIIELYNYMLEIFNLKVLMSDEFHSSGGEKLWNAILKKADKDGLEIGYVDKKNKTVHEKTNGVKFTIWYNDIVDVVYGNSSDHTYYSLYIKKD